MCRKHIVKFNRFNPHYFLWTITHKKNNLIKDHKEANRAKNHRNRKRNHLIKENKNLSNIKNQNPINHAQNQNKKTEIQHKKVQKINGVNFNDVIFSLIPIVYLLVRSL